MREKIPTAMLINISDLHHMHFVTLTTGRQQSQRWQSLVARECHCLSLITEAASTFAKQFVIRYLFVSDAFCTRVTLLLTGHYHREVDEGTSCRSSSGHGGSLRHQGFEA